jgi:thiol-disulfide isomerase/thioredoxin
MQLLKIVLLLCISVKVMAQTPITEGQFRYIEIDKFTTKFGKTKQTQRDIVFSFNQNYFRTEGSIPGKLSTLVLSDLTKSNTKAYINNSENYYMAEEKFAPSFFDMGMYNDVEPNVEIKNETSTINGIECKKAILNFDIEGTKEAVTLWYDPDYALQNNKITNLFKAVPGLPMKFSFKKKSRLAIGMPDVERFTEVVLADMFLTSQPNISAIAEIEKYEELAGDDKQQKIIEMYSKGNSMPQIKNKGMAITDTIKLEGGGSLLLTKYNPFVVGDKLASFTANKLQAGSKSLTDYSNKVLVLNFWHTACGPCIKEMPGLNEIAQRYSKNKEVAFAAVTFNTADEVQKFLTKRKFAFEQLVDAAKAIEQYAVSSYPTTVVLDKAGVIKYVKIGDAIAELDAEIKKLL